MESSESLGNSVYKSASAANLARGTLESFETSSR
jgi:hypothetical protein